MAQNVYIHIPFCRQKCNYCSFISFSKLDNKTEYINSLCNEIALKYKNEKLKTLYFGGGTPSLLEISEFEKIISLFNIDENTEFTTELNPENLDEEYLKNLKTLGVNRISLGCQTFNDKILKIIGRHHNGSQVKQVVKLAQDVGFNNISLDFIYGLPEQTEEDFINDLQTAINLKIQHISLYGLKIDEGCFFFKNPPQNLPDDELQAKMYLKAIDLMNKNNFSHYEISNFSVEGFNSNHNLNYWQNNSYYGFGVAAHGYIDGIRYSNPLTLKKYIENPAKPEFEHTLSEQEKLEEEIFLGFRCMNGINTNTINNKFYINFDLKYKNILDKYISLKYIEKTDEGYRFTTSGILISNYILADFLE